MIEKKSKEQKGLDSESRKAKKGDKVRVHYTGKFDDGSIFDSSEGREPLEFVVGEKQVIPGFDNALSGMAVGDEKSFKVLPADGYGERNEELVQEIPTEHLKEADKFKQGMVLALRGTDGRVLNAIVAKIDSKKMTLDLNHPLAGKNLSFTIKLEGIE